MSDRIVIAGPRGAYINETHLMRLLKGNKMADKKKSKMPKPGKKGC